MLIYTRQTRSTFKIRPFDAELDFKYEISIEVTVDLCGHIFVIQSRELLNTEWCKDVRADVYRFWYGLGTGFVSGTLWLNLKCFAFTYECRALGGEDNMYMMTELKMLLVLHMNVECLVEKIIAICRVWSGFVSGKLFFTETISICS